MRTSRLDPAVFRDVIGHFVSGVTIITTRHDGEDYGLTANAVSSLSLEPPMLLACLNMSSVTHSMVAAARAFAVNILDEDQGALAERFAASGGDKFAGVPYHHGELGLPLLDDALAYVECEVAENIVGGTHQVFLGTAAHAHARSGAPLTYFRGAFGRFSLARDARCYDQLRALVLQRQLPLNEPLDLDALVERLGFPPSSVHYGLVQLVADGLVMRVPGRGYLQRPVNERTSDEAFQAKLVIDLGVADAVGGKVGADAAAELRRLAEAALPLVDGGRVTDVAGYIAVSVAFQEYVVGLADNRSLIEAYRRLSIAEIMAPALTRPDPLRDQLARGRLALADAYAAGDLQAIRRLIFAQHRLSRAAQRAAIRDEGGRL